MKKLNHGAGFYIISPRIFKGFPICQDNEYLNYLK